MIFKLSTNRSRSWTKTTGFSLIEVLVVIAIVGFLVTLIVQQAKPPFVTVFANDLAAVIQQSRYEAVQRNTGVAVVHVANQGFEVRTIPGNNASCVATNYQVLRSLKFAGRGSVNVTMNKSGIIWLPNGLILACDGTQPFVNINVFDNSGKTRVLTINSIGRVEIQ